jgi:hypothetical protein
MSLFVTSPSSENTYHEVQQYMAWKSAEELDLHSLTPDKKPLVKLLNRCSMGHMVQLSEVFPADP